METFKEFFEQRMLEESEDNQKIKITEENGYYQIQYAARENGLSVYLKDILESLRNEFKMSKKDFPTNKAEFTKFANASTNRGNVVTKDEVTIQWYKSSPPLKFLKLTCKNKETLEKYASILEDIISVVQVTPQRKIDLWNEEIPKDVEAILTTAWIPELEPINVVTYLDNEIKVELEDSEFYRDKLPSGFKFIDDPKTTNFSIRTNRGRLVKFMFHTYNDTAMISWE